MLRAGPYYFVWPLRFYLLATKECKSKHFTFWYIYFILEKALVILIKLYDNMVDYRLYVKTYLSEWAIATRYSNSSSVIRIVSTRYPCCLLSAFHQRVKAASSSAMEYSFLILDHCSILNHNANNRVHWCVYYSEDNFAILTHFLYAILWSLVESSLTTFMSVDVICGQGVFFNL